jgi:hypothetical protein
VPITNASVNPIARFRRVAETLTQKSSRPTTSTILRRTSSGEGRMYGSVSDETSAHAPMNRT